jgi:hypothetical protein
MCSAIHWQGDQQQDQRFVESAWSVGVEIFDGSALAQFAPIAVAASSVPGGILCV